MIHLYSVIQPDGTTVNSVYLLTGEPGLQSGSRTYPVGYSYDYAGRVNMMTNWSNFSGGNGARVTTWKYDGYRGFLTNKVYDGSTAGPSYTYTAAGRPQTRKWARGITATYSINNAGDLATVVYSDGKTPNRTNSYDRLGRLNSVKCNGITNTLAYNLANELLSESYSNGILNGLSVTNGYDANLRRTSLALNSQLSTLSSTAYSYDNASRLSTVSDGNNNSATNSYLANSPLVGQITFKSNSVTRMTTTKQYDYLNRLTSISSVGGASSASPISFNYNYNNANQRTRNAQADGSYWIYNYDSLGQVTSGHKYWSDGTPVAGQQFDYTFDTIGNRTQTQAGGDQDGMNLRTANYYANNLNQLTNRDVPGYVDVKGVSFANNTVTVNGQAADRKGEYFRNELSVSNSSLALWTNIITAATGQTSITGNVFVAKAPEPFSYDADGNLTNDGRFNYTWDGENRLINLTSLTNAPTGSKVKLDFAYDYQGRRIQKIVSTNYTSGTNYTTQYTNRFVYDGWNLIAVLSPNSQLLSSYTWGKDLSGSKQGAGGVGGLLEATYYGSSTTNCFVAYDGNGNVAALVNAADGAVSANYEYGPFGEIIRMTGPMAQKNPFRFSTKYQDDESDLLYYGYRYYKLSTGTWPNRDPIGELGGHNLYGFVGNNPVSLFDEDGQVWFYGIELTPKTWQCGGVFELWDIHFDNPIPKNGYWVQKLTNVKDWTECGWFGNSHHHEEVVFWEIGKRPFHAGFPKGLSLAGDEDVGQDEWRNIKSYDHSVGQETITGESRFYFLKRTGILDWHDNIPGGFTTAGTLHEPVFWQLPPDAGEKVATHTTTINWSCCCSPKWDIVRSNPPTNE
jgi:RHS repeat-associated protein